jgi:hypothetical protein
VSGLVLRQRFTYRSDNAFHPPRIFSSVRFHFPDKAAALFFALCAPSLGYAIGEFAFAADVRPRSGEAHSFLHASIDSVTVLQFLVDPRRSQCHTT